MYVTNFTAKRLSQETDKLKKACSYVEQPINLKPTFPKKMGATSVNKTLLLIDRPVLVS